MATLGFLSAILLLLVLDLSMILPHPHNFVSLSAYSCSATVCCVRMHIHAKPQTGKFLELCRRLHSKYSEHPASFAPSVSEL